MDRLGFSCFALAILCSAVAAENDVLDLSEGSVVWSYSSEYSDEWTALNVLDGGNERGWSTAKGAPFPHRLLIELPATVQLRSVVIDNSTAQESSNPGISAKDVEIRLATSNNPDAFVTATEGEAGKGERTELVIDPVVEGQWLEVVIHSNWGEPNYTEIMELEGYGIVQEGPEADLSSSGTFMTNYGPITLNEEQSQVSGCYYEGVGTLTGRREGRVLFLEWRQEKDNGSGFSGPAVLALNGDATRLNGLWYGTGPHALKAGKWFGNRVDTQEASCSQSASDAIEQALTTEGRTRLYGIHFDVDSAQLRSTADATLSDLLTVLERSTDIKVTVEGHTDSDGDDAHNLQLSRDRAASVVAWLTERSIDPTRLKSIGYGEDKPVANNATAQGRQLNRRVEVSLRE